MGKLSNNIHGAFTGTVGPVVGSSWKGMPYIKSASKKRTGRTGAGEIANREKFTQAHQWLKPVIEFVRVGFKNYTETVEGFIAAKSLLLRNAFEGIVPNRFINPALVKLSHGSLPLATDISVAKNGDGQLQFSWNNGRIEDSHPKDQAMLLAYDVAHHEATYSLTGQFRESGSDLLALPSITGGTYHIYFAMLAHDRSRQSDSIYLGTINT